MLFQNTFSSVTKKLLIIILSLSTFQLSAHKLISIGWGAGGGERTVFGDASMYLSLLIHDDYEAIIGNSSSRYQNSGKSIGIIYRYSRSNKKFKPIIGLFRTSLSSRKVSLTNNSIYNVFGKNYWGVYSGLSIGEVKSNEVLHARAALQLNYRFSDAKTIIQHESGPQSLSTERAIKSRLNDGLGISFSVIFYYNPLGRKKS